MRCIGRIDRGVRFVKPENWHVTLRFLGEAHPDDVVDALAGTPFEPATARLGPGVDLLFDRMLVVPVAGVDDLARAVITRTASIGEPPRKRFVGHLTLARVKPHAPMPPALGSVRRGRVPGRGGRARAEPSAPRRRSVRDPGDVAGTEHRVTAAG